MTAGRNDFRRIEDWPSIVWQEFVQAMTGDHLGYGMSRHVYAHPQNPDMVIKVEFTANTFQNILEWKTWDALSHTKHSKWLAPCISISSSGQVLLQKRTTPLVDGKEPKRLPAWLADTKRVNYGLFDGRVVCHDYGTNLLLNHGVFKAPMVEVRWW